MQNKVKDLLNLQGKTAVITGSTGCLGRDIVRRLSGAGCNVFIAYRSDEAAAQELKDEVESSFNNSAYIVCVDVADEVSVSNMFDFVAMNSNGIDLLVNNAGVYPHSSLLDISTNEWNEMIDANLRSCFLCTKLASKQMIEHGRGGSIVNMASMAASFVMEGLSHYSAAKSGVVMFSRSAAFELGKHGIRVNTVSPGVIWKEGIEEDWPDGVNRYVRSAPLGRLGQPEDVADACLFLCSPAAKWVTGIDLPVDGGITSTEIF